MAGLTASPCTPCSRSSGLSAISTHPTSAGLSAFTPLLSAKRTPMLLRRGPQLNTLRRGLSCSITYHIQRRGQTSAALLSREEKEKLLAGVARDHVNITTLVLEQATSAAQQWAVVHSDFLTPPAKEDTLMVLGRLADVGVLVSGGFPEAERCRLSVGHPEALQSQLSGLTKDEEAQGYPGAVAALNLGGNFKHDGAVHGDFLGALLSTGITREKVGDIIVQGDRGAQVLLVPQLVDFVMTSLTRVRNVPVVVEPIPLSDLEVREPRVDVIRSVEASLRVDALASAALKISRTKLADLISGGQVRLNWRAITKSGTLLKTGDMVSVRGKGRIQVGDITMTKKGRYSVELTRFT
eukprot:TRINITY_DN6346_c0_g1_i1.p1 TRINITY_DN6346_c0_g1~~TRINITY_DN6346_c0_g1_i1.p1  ORF type:complete len:353 (-),score=43.34 TRINITY_DN6346_c0_g1_i1:389-1447(-)